MTPDTLMDLTDDDLTTLVEALEAWETKDFSGELMGMMLESVLAKGDDNQRAQREAQRELEKAKRERQKEIRKEQSVILRAKLLVIRNRRRVESVESASARLTR